MGAIKFEKVDNTARVVLENVFSYKGIFAKIENSGNDCLEISAINGDRECFIFKKTKDLIDAINVLDEALDCDTVI